jgi:PAS domain S-box-containing protein
VDPAEDATVTLQARRTSLSLVAPPPMAPAGSYLAAVRASEPHQATLDSLEDHIAVLDAQGTILITNRAWDRFAAENGGVGLGADYLAACDAGDAKVGAALRDILAGRREHFRGDFACKGPERERWFVLSATRYRGNGPTRVVVKHQDVTEHRRVQQDARVLARLLDQVDAAVIAADLEGTVTHWSRGAETMHGWTAEETVGRPIGAFRLGLQDMLHAEVLAAVERGGWEGDVVACTKDGGEFPAYVRLGALIDATGRTTGVVGVGVDASERDRYARELRSAHDRLRAITDSMGEGLLVNDVDGRITYLNDAAGRMLGWSREELAGRVTHDVLRDEHGTAVSPEDCAIMRSIRDGVTLRVDDEAFVRRDGSLLPVAYTAAPFQTPDGVKGCVVIFSDITERKLERARTERDLEALTWITRIRDALEHERFVLHAQPIVDLTTGAIVQHELLIRMVDEDGRPIPPGLFLPIAEEYGLIREIDRWVIGQAVALAAAGNPVELNLSAESLGDPSLFSVVESALSETGADPRLLVFELTETALLENESAARGFIERVERLGCRLALDDFGTGYGGFTYLKRLPVHFLKIDIEFVRDLAQNPSSGHVVRAVVSLARGFGQKTVAEGVEDAATLELLRELGVDYAQGYGIARPAPAAEVLGGRHGPRQREVG